jgi:hypothetical protein
MDLFNTNINFAELNSQLQDFGLHPNDWKLSKQSYKQVKIQNKEEETFYFVGDIEKRKGKTQWKSIQLAGL